MTDLSRRGTLAAAIGLALAPAARAQAPTVTVTNPWTRAAGAGATGVGYMTLRNTGSAADRIVGGRTAAARSVELHTHIRDGDVMRMRPVPAIDLPPGQEVRLGPGGLHLMLIGLVAPLRQGERVPVTLLLERGGELQVELAVESAGARGPSAGAHRH
jgi:copper(I)-binding protein